MVLNQLDDMLYSFQGNFLYILYMFNHTVHKDSLLNQCNNQNHSYWHMYYLFCRFPYTGAHKFYNIFDQAQMFELIKEDRLIDK